MHSIWLKKRPRYSHVTPYTIMLGFDVIGRCEIERRYCAVLDDRVWSLHIGIDEPFQRQGIGTYVHDLTEFVMRSEPTSRHIPSPSLSTKAQLFWQKRAPELMLERRETKNWNYPYYAPVAAFPEIPQCEPLVAQPSLA